jgi:hypothetical protein
MKKTRATVRALSAKSDAENNGNEVHIELDREQREAEEDEHGNEDDEGEYGDDDDVNGEEEPYEGKRDEEESTEEADQEGDVGGVGAVSTEKTESAGGIEEKHPDPGLATIIASSKRTNHKNNGIHIDPSDDTVQK